jgi:predicted RNase H-like HicB family nuclease
MPTKFHCEFDQEEDGRWIAEVPELSGVMVYGATKQEAQAKAEALALRVLADQIEEKQEARAIAFAC